MNKLRIGVLTGLALIVAVGLTWQVSQIYANCTGTISPGADNVTCTDVSPSVNTGAGSDTVTNNGEIPTIQTGLGADTVTNNGDAQTIDSGLGDDTVTNNGEAQGITTGFGNDTVTNNGDALIIAGGAGNDTITNNGDALAISTGPGQDTVTNNGEANIILTGDGDDTIDITEGGNVEGAIITSSIPGGPFQLPQSDNDTLNIDGNVTGVILTGEGDDTLYIGENGTASGLIITSDIDLDILCVCLGNDESDDDTVIIDGAITPIDLPDSIGPIDLPIDTLPSALITGEGDDYIEVNGSMTGIIYTSDLPFSSDGQSDNDTVIINGSVNGTNLGLDLGFISIDSIPGLVATGRGNDYIEVNGIVDGMILTGDDDDSVVINGTVTSTHTGLDLEELGISSTIGGVDTGRGNDWVGISGTIDGTLSTGEGDDLVEVVLGEGQVSGLMDGGTENTADTLLFHYTFEAEDFYIPEEFAAIEATLAAIDFNTCPVEGCPVSLTVNGLVFTYNVYEFEDVRALLHFIKITFTPYDEMNCQNGVKCFALKDKGFRNGNVQIYAASGEQGVGVATVNFNRVGTGGYSYTNPDNGWTVDIVFLGTEGDARLYNITLSKDGDVRNAMTQVMAFSFSDTNAFTNALGWR